MRGGLKGCAPSPEGLPYSANGIPPATDQSEYSKESSGGVGEWCTSVLSFTFLRLDLVEKKERKELQRWVWNHLVKILQTHSVARPASQIHMGTLLTGPQSIQDSGWRGHGDLKRQVSFPLRDPESQETWSRINLSGLRKTSLMNEEGRVLCN